MGAPASPGDRREFLLRVLRLGAAGAATTGVGTWLHARSARPQEAEPAVLSRHLGVPPDPALPEIVVAQGERPAELVRRAVIELGGMRRFVSRQDIVVLKPNIAWDRAPEMAATTNPDVVAELVRLCLDAGAKRVIVTDVSCHDARSTFSRSGIAEAARRVGAEVLLPEPRFFRRVDLRGETLGVWPVLVPFLEADKVINVPIAKHHSLTGVTLGLKNWYGLVGGDRNRLHQRIHESIADLASFLRPTLTVLDGYRILARNGPTGGSTADVEFKKTVLAGTDPVAIDAWAAKAWWDLDPRRLRFLREVEGRGLGRADFASVRSRIVSL